MEVLIMNFDSYITSDTKTAITVLPKCPPPLSHKGFSKKTLKQKAFTLAEVLITLTIIGVVAAMTIPTLMSKYKEQTYVTGLKKAYSQLQNAWRMIPLSEGCPAGDYACAFGTTENILKIISNQFKLTKYCDKDDTSEDCKFKEIFRNAHYEHAFITQDGMIFAGRYQTIAVDTNGLKGPNKGGLDQFILNINFPAHDCPSNIPSSAVSCGYTVSGHSEIAPVQVILGTHCTGVINESAARDCAKIVLTENAINYTIR